ncbi:Aspartate aminotransferase [Serratia odorifera]|uniref:Aspartate aminotransferase n=1 Tax=Serratia odorifera TaxID=618 RepID=A0A3S4EI98_SEROD|nr:Aspartate aminotransferase [Serratia odorifera]
MKGIPAFATCTQELLFGKDSAIISDKRARTAQTPGGTGGLRVAGDFIANQTSAKRVWISNPKLAKPQKRVLVLPAWKCWNMIIMMPTTHALNFDGLINSLKQAQAGDVVVFHGCCHNPTGIDPTPEQWSQLAELSAQSGWLPLFDFAYQGFANGLEEDAQGLRISRPSIRN